MNVSELNPEPTSKALFKLSSFKQVPKIGGCYVLTTFEGLILYIGLASNLYIRFQQHLDNPEKTDATGDGRAFWIFFTHYDEGNLNRLERTWLNHYVSHHGCLPILNKINSPVS